MGSFLGARTILVDLHHVHLEHLGPLRTTRNEIFSALTALPEDTDRIVEVETYAWSALPDSVRPELVEGIALELESLA